MTSDIFDDEAWAGNRRAPAVAPARRRLDLNTADLLVEEGMPDAAATPSSAPAVEEAAILYANGQLDAAEAASAHQPASTSERRNERQPWWMLFDLYQASGREPAVREHRDRLRQPFRDLAAGSYSPGRGHGERTGPSSLHRRDPDRHPVRPARRAPARRSWRACWHRQPAGALRIQHDRHGHAGRLRALLWIPCRPAPGGRELVVAGADHLVAVLRPMLAIGDRGAGEAPWLLLLELLLLMNREKDFEETAMDYCVTFEVSPPSFEAPARAAAQRGRARLPTPPPATASCCRPDRGRQHGAAGRHRRLRRPA
jgi:hypothetical protein